MRKSGVYLLVFLLLATTVSGAPDMQYLQGLGDTRYHHIESAGIERGYHVYVMLPAGYEGSPDKEYPTIYLLDGGELFPLFAAYYRYLNFGEEVPDAVIVGISYGSDSAEHGNFRNTDFTAPSAEREYWGGAENFQAFLSDELVPFIESTYRSRVDRRIIFGQSIGGQFVLYTALTRPDLFWGHIASNPALHRNLAFFLEQHAEPESTDRRSKLFVASGTLDDPRFRAPAMEWINYWTNRESPWELKTMNLDGHTHMSAPPASFRQGMAWLFAADKLASTAADE